MISRKSTVLIARVYTHFAIEDVDSRIAPTWTLVKIGQFLYEEDYPEWFLKRLARVESPDEFDQLIFGLQTGRSIRKSFTQAPGNSLGIGQSILKKLAADVYRFRFNDSQDIPGITSSVEGLQKQLELDGYILRNGKLYEEESSVIDTQAEQSYLEQLIDSLGLSEPTTVKHHINLAEEHYTSGRYTDSIHNSRQFLEAILVQVLENIDAKRSLGLNANVYKNAAHTRDHLHLNGLLTIDEKDTIGKIYGLLSNTGGHPFIAEKDQARLMWHLALTNSQFILLRYEGFKKANP